MPATAACNRGESNQILAASNAPLELWTTHHSPAAVHQLGLTVPGQGLGVGAQAQGVEAYRERGQWEIEVGAIWRKAEQGTSHARPRPHRSHQPANRSGARGQWHLRG